MNICGLANISILSLLFLLPICNDLAFCERERSSRSPNVLSLKEFHIFCEQVSLAALQRCFIIRSKVSSKEERQKKEKKKDYTSATHILWNTHRTIYILKKLKAGFQCPFFPELSLHYNMNFILYMLKFAWNQSRYEITMYSKFAGGLPQNLPIHNHQPK